ncbi:MAG: bacteriocin immunity protein [Vagococcus fluvialis]
MNQDREVAKESIHQLYNAMSKWDNQSIEVLDILDCLRQVYVKIDKEKRPEVLVNRLVQYVRSLSLKGRLHYPKKEEALMMILSKIGQKAGFNGAYRANYSDKSQFFSYFDTEKLIYRS